MYTALPILQHEGRGRFMDCHSAPQVIPQLHAAIQLALTESVYTTFHHQTPLIINPFGGFGGLISLGDLVIVFNFILGFRAPWEGPF